MAESVSESVGGRPAALKAYPYIPPRLDADQFQANVPAWDGEVLRDDRRVPSPSAAAALSDLSPLYSLGSAPPDASQEYLLFSRQLLRGHGGGAGETNPALPLQSDARALEFLAFYNYEVDHANFALYNDLACGKELHFTELATSFIDKNPVNALFNEYKERYHRNQSKPFFGSFVSAPRVGETSAPPSSLVTSSSSALCDNSCNGALDNANDESLNPNTGRSSHRVANSERLESRKRWMTLLETTQSVLFAPRHSQHRLDLRSAQSLLDEAVSIPLPLAMLSGAGSAAQATEDFAAIDRLRSNLGEIVKRVVLSREWTADVRDTLYRKEIDLLVHDPIVRRHATSLSTLSELVRRGEGLDCPDTTVLDRFKQIVQNLHQLQQELRTFFSHLSASPLRPFYHLLKGNATANTMGITGIGGTTQPALGSLYQKKFINTTFSAAEVEDRLAVQYSWPSLNTPALSAEDVGIMLVSYEELLEKPQSLVSNSEAHLQGGADVPPWHNSPASGTRGNNHKNKMTLAEVDRLLSLYSKSASEAQVAEIAYLHTVRQVANQLATLAQRILNNFCDLQRREKVPMPAGTLGAMGNNGAEPPKVRGSHNHYQVPILSLARVTRFCQAALQYPLVLPAVQQLQQLLDKVYAWKREVRALPASPNAASGALPTSETTTSSRRSSRKTGSDSTSGGTNGKAVSMKRVEALLQEGLRYPFTSDREIAILREKKEQGKIWLDRLKRTFGMATASSTGKNSRASRKQQSLSASLNTSSTTDGADDGNSKLTLDEMRLMVAEGEALYQEAEDSAALETTGSSNSRTTKGVPRGVWRDIDRAQSVIETASQWVDRVRQAVTNQMARGYHGLGLAAPEKEPKRESSPEDKEMELLDHLLEVEEDNVKEEEEEESEEVLLEERSDLAASLTALLEEADAMPVVLEETDCLRLQLSALQWAIKARPVLLRCISQPSEQQLEGQASVEPHDLTTISSERLLVALHGMKLPVTASAVGGVKQEQQEIEQEDDTVTPPSYVELVELKQEISRIRDRWEDQRATSASLELDLHLLPEEVVLGRMLQRAGEIVQSVKKCVVGREIRRGTNLHQLLNQLCLATSLPVVLDNELKAARLAARAALDWMADWSQILDFLGVWDPVDRLLVQRSRYPNSSTSGSSSSASRKTSSASSQAKEEEELPNQTRIDDTTVAKAEVPDSTPAREEKEEEEQEGAAGCSHAEFDRLQRTLAASIVVDFPTARAVKGRGFELASWLGKVRQLARDHADLLQRHGNLLTGQTTRKKRVAPSAVGGNDQPAADAISGSSAVPSSEQSSASSANAPVDWERLLLSNGGEEVGEGQQEGGEQTLSVVVLDNLLAAGQVLGIELSEESAPLVQLHSLLSLWLADRGQTFPSRFHALLQAVHQEMREVCHGHYLPLLEGAPIGDAEKQPLSLEALAPFPLEPQLTQDILAFQKRVSEGLKLRVSANDEVAMECGLVYRQLLLVDQVVRRLIFGPPPPAPIYHWGDVPADLVSGLQDLITSLRGVIVEARGKTSTIEAFTATFTTTFGSFLGLSTQSEDTAISGEEARREGEQQQLQQQQEEEKTAESEAMEQEVEHQEEGAMEVAVEETQEEAPAPLPAAAARGTRLASGIHKRKRDADFADTTRLHILRGVAPATTAEAAEPARELPPAPAPSSSKKRRTSASTAAENTADPPASKTSASSSGDTPWVVLCKQWGISLDLPAQYHHLLSRLQDTSCDATEEVLLQLYDLYLVLLSTLQTRLREVATWRQAVAKAQHTLSSTTTSSHPLVHLFESARLRGLRCSERVKLEEDLTFSQEWLAQAQRFLGGATDKWSLEAVKDFLKSGDRVLLPHSEEVAKLKLELKKFKTWKHAYDAYLQQSQQGGSSTSTSRPVDEEEGSGANPPTGNGGTTADSLLAEAEQLLINLSDYTEVLNQANRRYCLCRNIYHGQMIGCDSCDDWYHLACVNLTPAQADKYDRYTCVRCALRSSVAKTANEIVTMSNKWTDKSSALRPREQMIEKLQKRLDRLEQKDSHHLVLQHPSAATAAAAISVLTTGATSPTLVKLPGDGAVGAVAGSAVAYVTPKQPAAVAPNQEAERMRAELSALRRERNREHARFRDIAYWMAALQRLLTSASRSVSAQEGVAGSSSDHVHGQGSALLSKFSQPFDPFDEAYYPFLLLNPLLLSVPPQPFPAASGPVSSLVWSSASAQDAPAAVAAPAAGPVEANPPTAPPSPPVELLLEHYGPGVQAAYQWLFQRNNTPSSTSPPPAMCAYPGRENDFARGMRALSHHLSSGMLCLGSAALALEAKRLALEEVEEVVVLIDALRSMNWCSAALQLLRYPPPTPLLKQLVESSKSLHFLDEKIVRFLLLLLQRQAGWKAKVRRYATQAKKLEDQKVVSLTLEANAMPFTSRIKDYMRRLAQKHLGPTNALLGEGAISAAPVPTTVTASEGAGGAGNTEGQQAAAPTGPGRRASASKAAARTALLGSGAAAGKVVLTDLPDSSDEEDSFQASRSGDHVTAPTTTFPSSGVRRGYSQRWAERFSYPDGADLASAVAPSQPAAWPPVLTTRMALPTANTER